MDPTEVTTAYFDAWLAQDFDRLRALLADGVTFRGPIGSADDADGCLAGLRGMRQVVTDVRVLLTASDGADVLTWYDLATGDDDPTPVAQWSHVEGDRITRIRATFDPRRLLPAEDR